MTFKIDRDDVDTYIPLVGGICFILFFGSLLAWGFGILF